MTSLHDQVIIVTGASSGIGAALARLCLQAGARVVLTARREDRMQSLAADFPAQSLVVPADLIDENQRRTMVQQVLAKWQRIDILFNNAGLGAYGAFLETTPAVWRRLFEINLFAPVFLTQTVLPCMQSQGSGLIVNIASIAGLMAHSENVSIYAASKHAFLGFTRALAKDLAPTRIRVKAACPHLTDTDFFDVSQGGEGMADLVSGYRPKMDSANDVARGILDRLDQPEVVIFPTSAPARAYARQHDKLPPFDAAEMAP